MFLHHPEQFEVLHAPYSALLEEHFARHGQLLVSAHPYPSSLPEWDEQRCRLRRRFITALGLSVEDIDASPEARGPLCARTVGVVDRARDGYIIERVEFQSSPRVYVSANLYLPAKTPPGARLPAVLSPHGHWPTGKHTRHIQIRSANLARRGYAVLVVDTIGQSERTFMGHRDPVTHALLCAGKTMPGLQVWDNLRAVDYLCSRAEVDRTRIGLTGASGGGNHTTYLAAIDARIAAAIPVCSVELLEIYFRKSQCVCETIPDLLTFADKSHLLGLIAPRALLIMNGMRDSGFSTLSARQAFDQTRRIFELFPGGADRVALYETNVEHSYDRTMRERAYAWFDQWLQGRSPEDAAARSREADTWVEAEEDDTLCVWSPGGIPRDAHTVNSLYAELSTAVPRHPAGDADAFRRSLRGLLGPRWSETPSDWATPAVEVVGAVEREDCTIQRLVYWSDEGVPVPALLFQPKSHVDVKKPGLVYTNPAGKARAPELRAVHEAVRAGAVVLSIDYRGQGETAGTGNQGELPAVERGLMLGQPLFGGRLRDLLQAVTFLASLPNVDPKRIFVWGERDAALLALWAAALDPRIAGAALFDLPESYAGKPDSPVTMAPWLAVPGVLSTADVPDLLRLVAPRALVTGGSGTAAEQIPKLVE
jgi:cephalosporin-C deacetylase-like acetyl esterase